MIEIFKHYWTESSLCMTCMDARKTSFVVNELSNGHYYCGDIEPIELMALDDDDSPHEAKFFDVLPFYSGGVLVNKRAFDSLKGILDGSVQWVRFRYLKQDYYYANVIEVLDILDTEKTIFKKVNGIDLFIQEFRFKNDNIFLPPIFKLSYNPKLPPLVTGDFVNAFRRLNLTGLEFEKIGELKSKGL